MSEGEEAGAPCRWCGGEHREVPRICPYVKALEFAPENGQIITRVEFFSPVECFGPQKVEAPADDYPRKKSS